MDNLYRNYPASELVRYDLGWHEPPWLPESVREMHRQAQWFLNDLAHHHSGTAPRWLTLCGHSGCGKTYLAAAIRNTAKYTLGYTEQQTQLRNASILASRLRDGDMGLLTFLCNIPVLVLDDLGAEYPSDFIRSKIYELMESRLNKWTVITSNLSVADIADRLDVRIASRIKRGANVLVESKEPFDFCWKAKEQNYTAHLKKHDHKPTERIQPSPAISQNNMGSTPAEQAAFREWLHTNIAECSALAKPCSRLKYKRIPR